MPGRLKRDKMVEKHKEENEELWTERGDREKQDKSRDTGGTDRRTEKKKTERQRKRARGRERERERGSSASLPDNETQCSKGQPHCTTTYCTIHRIQN